MRIDPMIFIAPLFVLSLLALIGVGIHFLIVQHEWHENNLVETIVLDRIHQPRRVQSHFNPVTKITETRVRPERFIFEVKYIYQDGSSRNKVINVEKEIWESTKVGDLIN